MDGEAWWAIVHGVTRVGRNLVTSPPPPGAQLYPALGQLRVAETKNKDSSSTEEGTGVQEKNKMFQMIRVVG